MSYVKCHSRYAHKMWWGPEKGLNPAGHTGWYQGGSVLLLKNFLPMLCPNHPMSLRVEERFKQVLVKFPSGCLWWAFNAYGGGGINCRLSPMCSAMGPGPQCVYRAGAGHMAPLDFTGLHWCWDKQRFSDCHASAQPPALASLGLGSLSSQKPCLMTPDPAVAVEWTKMYTGPQVNWVLIQKHKGKIK